MVTGMRRAELLALRWSDVDLDAAVLTVRRNYVRVKQRSIEKDTKTHQMRRLALDPATVEVLTEHRDRYWETTQIWNRSSRQPASNDSSVPSTNSRATRRPMAGASVTAACITAR